MMSGIDRYFQLARNFRDEQPAPTASPSTQIDQDVPVMIYSPQRHD